MILKECSDGKDNIVSLIKFIAAVMVIFNHSFPITGSGSDYISVASGGQTTFGGIAVAIFFFYGGFLIMRSMEHKKTAASFFKARSLRIFPQLIIVIILSVFVLGAIISDCSLVEYFSNLNTYKYLLNCVMIPIHSLPGVFLNSKYNSTVNGSLWTLPVEFLCYVFCYLFYRFRLNNRKYAVWTVPFIVIAYLILWKILSGILILRAVLTPAMLFYTGMIYYIYRDKIKLYWYISVILLCALIVGIYFNIYYLIALVALPYIFSYLGFSYKISKIDINKNLLVKSSYGIYLVAFPIQQTLCVMNSNMSQMTNFLLATVVSGVLGCVLTLLDKRINAFIKKGSAK